MESLLPAVVQAIIGGVFAILAVYVGHVLRSRRAGSAEITVETENVRESPVGFRSTASATTKRENTHLLRCLADVAAIVSLVLCVDAAAAIIFSLGPLIYQALFYVICIPVGFFLVLKFKEPRWLPVLMATPICVVIDSYFGPIAFFTSAAVALGAAFAVIYKSLSEIL
jgi:hypothetical protein